jgi:hypothetical protein
MLFALAVGHCCTATHLHLLVHQPDDKLAVVASSSSVDTCQNASGPQHHKIPEVNEAHASCSANSQGSHNAGSTSIASLSTPSLFCAAAEATDCPVWDHLSSAHRLIFAAQQ